MLYFYDFLWGESVKIQIEQNGRGKVTFISITHNYSWEMSVWWIRWWIWQSKSLPLSEGDKECRIVINAIKGNLVKSDWVVNNEAREGILRRWHLSCDLSKKKQRVMRGTFKAVGTAIAKATPHVWGARSRPMCLKCTEQGGRRYRKRWQKEAEGRSWRVL